MRDINFFSSLENSKKSNRKSLYVIIGYFTVLIVLIGGALLALDIMKANLQKQLDVTQEYLNSPDISAQKNEVEQKQIKVNAYNKYLRAVESIDNKLNNTFTLKSSFINSIDRTIPSDIFFTSVNYTSSTFTAQCTAGSKTSIAGLYRSFYDLGFFDNVYIADINRVSESPERYGFRIQCTIKGGAMQ